MLSRFEENRVGLMPNDIFLRKVYFFLKPILPKKVRLYLRRKHISWKRFSYADIWPIDPRAKQPPIGWSGWPEGSQFALVLTHDVETEEGQEKSIPLANLEESLGLRSSFNFIAEQYKVSQDCQACLKAKGFEIGLHGIIHNGTPFRSRRTFEKQAAKINRYLKEWNVSGFRCPSMYHNLDWIGELDVEYDASTFDTDPFEPQPDGVGTVFPFWVQGRYGDRGYLELPYTLPQDHTLFVVMEEKTIDIWKKKLDWIAGCGGMALLITHPDYMDFSGKGKNIGEYPVSFYREFLNYVDSKYKGKYWNPLPKDIVRFWKSRVPHSSGREPGDRPSTPTVKLSNCSPH
jgi:hypothetical protein